MSDTTALLPAIRETIRRVEGGSYGAKPASSSATASGAYQFTTATWLANGGGQYAPAAYLATPAQQDAIADRKISAILASTSTATLHDQLSAVAQTWYLGHVASPSELNQVPGRGNKLTVAEYTAKWLKTFAGIPGTPAVGLLGGGGTGSVNGGVVGVIKDVTDPIGEAASAAANAVTGLLGDALGALVDPFLTGLRRLTLIGLAVALGVGLVGFGAYRSVNR